MLSQFLLRKLTVHQSQDALSRKNLIYQNYLGGSQIIYASYSPIFNSFFKSLGKGKYGRILGEFLTLDGETNINELMIHKHHAVSYHGASKADIAEGHLKNRTRVKEI